VLLFGIPEETDELGSGAWDEYGIVQRALHALRAAAPSLLLLTDVCLCEYTSHGHCGVLVDGEVANDETLDLLARTAVSHVEAGADAVAPSDMMDGRVGALRTALDDHDLSETPIIAYSAKFASAFYGALVGLTQSDPRSILAYSSISQMGLVAALCGIGLATGYTGTPAVVAFYAAHHVLVKGSLFLALPVASAAGDTSFRRLLPAIGVIALALAGLPLTGGYIAKFAIKPMLDGGMTGFLGMAYAPFVDQARLGHSLEPSELLDVAGTLAVARNTHETIDRLRVYVPHVAEIADGIAGAEFVPLCRNV
jgi:hypothetical protein